MPRTAATWSTLEAVTPELESILRRGMPRYFLDWSTFESSFVPMARGQWDAAVARMEEAMALTLRSGYLQFRPMFLAHIGWVHRSRGDYGRALSVGVDAMDLAMETGHPWWTAIAGTQLGWTLTELGAFDRAIPQLERSLEAADRDGAESYVVRSLGHLALATWLGGQRDRTEDLLGRAEEILGGVRSGEGPSFLHGAHAYAATARTLIEMGRFDDAERLLAPVLATAGPAGWREAAAETAMLTAGLASPQATSRQRRPCWSGRWTGRGTPICPAWRGRRTPCWRTRGPPPDRMTPPPSTARLGGRPRRSIAGTIEDEELRAGFVAVARRRLRAPRR